MEGAARVSDLNQLCFHLVLEQLPFGAFAGSRPLGLSSPINIDVYTAAAAAAAAMKSWATWLLRRIPTI